MSAGSGESREAGVIGRTLRLMLGLLFGWMTFTVLRSESPAFALGVVGVLAGLAIGYTVIHLVVARYGSGLSRWLGSAVVLVPFVVLFAAGGPRARAAAIGFAAIALLLQTVRGNAGCVLMEIPALLSRRPTHLGGIVFAPIDLIERHLTGPGGLPG